MPTLSLGHRVAPSTLTPTGAPALLDAATLTRHAVCVGMTGSGKTGLCVSLLEELALAGVPILALDPKGDLANLALVFPELAPSDFLPWTDPADAARQGLTPEALATATAARWREGLEADGVAPASLQAFRERVEVTVITPGSEAGVPLDVLSALTRPPAGIPDGEALREYVTGAVGALLRLVDEPADPLTDPPAILLGRLLGDAFAAGEELPFDVLLSRIVDPPFDRLGYFAVEDVISRKRRRDLALRLNTLLTSPAFATWRRGLPLDVGALLAPVDGRTQLRVIYLAHLDDAQRMFVVSLVLNAVVAWTRRLPGTSSLRALVYVDEVVGYLPPHPANPPSKGPVLTLMKQARAVGVGTMLCTQNPVDVDYKALSNAGTWLVGRLQTRQDRDRLMADLMPADGGDPDVLDDLVGRLPGRTFVWKDARSGETRLLRSRHTRSFLRGPLTRREIAELAQVRPLPGDASPQHLRAPPPAPLGVDVRWLSPAGVPSHPAVASGEPGVWRAVVYARLHLRFDHRDRAEERVVHRLLLPEGGPDAEPLPVALDDAHLLREPPADGLYAHLPAWADEAGELRRLANDLVTRAWLRGSEVWDEDDGERVEVGLERGDVRLLALGLVWVLGAG